MEGVDLLSKQDSNLMTRLGFLPNQGFFGIMAGSFCVPAPGKYLILLSFGVNLEAFQWLWTNPCSNSRGLECHGAMQPGMLDFSPKTVQTATIAKSCTILGQSQRFAILEWGLVNPEKIEQFLERMNSDLFFRNYYFGLYDSLRLLHLMIFYRPAIVVSEAEKKWSSKLDNVLDA